MPDDHPHVTIYDRPDVTIPVVIPAWEAERLSALVDPAAGFPDLEAVVFALVDSAHSGVRRHGSWERQWVCRVFGEGWLERMEPDPDSPYFDRVRSVDG